MYRNGNMHLARGDQIHRDTPLVEDGKHPRQKGVGNRPLVRVDVEDRDLVLDRHGSRTLRLLAGRWVGWFPRPLDLLVGGQGRVWLDDGAFAAGVLDVLDSDGDWGLGLDHLVHGQVVDDFGAVKGQLGGLGWGDGRDESGGGDLGRVGGEDAINFLPDLKLISPEADSSQGSAEIRVATADVTIQKTSRDVTEEASDDWYTVLTRKDLLGNDGGDLTVKAGIEPPWAVKV